MRYKGVDHFAVLSAWVVFSASALKALPEALADGRSVARPCFRLPPGDAIMRGPTFAPPPQEAVEEGPDPQAAELRARFEREARNCSHQRHGGPSLPDLGVGSSLSFALRPFTRAYVHRMALQTPVTSGGTPITRYGLKPLDECLGAPSYSHPLEKKAEHVPPEFADQGLFWWTSQQFAWLLRPDDAFREHLAELKGSFGWEQSRPILGLHIRHGDSCNPHQEVVGLRKCQGLEAYMPAIRKLAGTYGYKAIYLATDDAEVMRRAPADFPEFQWMLSPSRRAQNRSAELNQHENRSGSVNMAAEYRDVLTDLFMLADADGFVGKFTSNVDRIAYSLGFGRRGCAVPMESLDSLWCSSWGNRVGRSLSSRRNFSC